MNQLRKAVVSITINIAEGFSRNTSKEKVQFYYMALGSLTEVHNQLIIAKDVDYLTVRQFNKLVNGLIKSARNMSR